MHLQIHISLNMLLLTDIFFWIGFHSRHCRLCIAIVPLCSALRCFCDCKVKHIILTGGTDTARSIAKAIPATPLSAETGGKNVIILTASGDRDHTIMNIVISVFGNAGQKCSACSLLLVERSVYEDKNFQKKLIDVATSMKVGSVWNPGNVVGPMITNKK